MDRMTLDKNPSALDWKTKAIEYKRKASGQEVHLMATNALLESENTALSISSAPWHLMDFSLNQFIR